ncbi:MAG: hypothetical protein F6J90_14235 [Moorea sp. SIOASIH]|uniref:hypothetical protein n=1 Tax=Moorena sp. SIOASIH TaxID=2607817 RepID=UPI0013BD8DFB|nr:hypothetical protein [Moorena sp. SIOASIH]NEO37421.1 hypothetical protein [Moorena sp. SIOASIH]
MYRIGILVELASCQFQLYRMGIRRRTGILPVSIDFRAGRMPTLLLFSAKIQQRPRFPIP